MISKVVMATFHNWHEPSCRFVVQWFTQMFCISLRWAALLKFSKTSAVQNATCSALDNLLLVYQYAVDYCAFKANPRRRNREEKLSV